MVTWESKGSILGLFGGMAAGELYMAPGMKLLGYGGNVVGRVLMLLAVLSHYWFLIPRAYVVDANSSPFGWA